MSSDWTTDATMAQRPSHDDAPVNGQAGGQQRSSDTTREIKRQSRHSRPQKPRSSGAFLLSDPFEDAAVEDTRPHKHRSRRAVEKGKSKSQRTSKTHSDEHIQNGRHSSLGLGLGLSPDPGSMGNGSAERPPRTSPGALGGDIRQDQLQESPKAPSPRTSTSSLDMESTQIVNMALNLSESRRMAQRRNASQPLPPRLVPLATDNSVAGSLRQQLQQQRRVSRTMSPKPERGTLSRLGSSGRVSSLQPAFDLTNDGSGYRYHFSSSTLARAQKAKDYMELLAQYRRALELLPPLKPNTLSKTSTKSDYALSASTSANPLNLDTAGQIGRPYDPLQYIRNRKVRARERKTIDGESQGFGDVSRVTDWVDEVAKWVATRQIRTPGSSALPPFAGADVFTVETSPPSRTSNAITKPKRPRNDWTIEPADLVADIYWLEQDDHKRLVEDRNWRRVFPQDSGLYRPLSQATNDASPAIASKNAQLQLSGPEDGPGKSTAEAKAPKAEHDHASGGTRERARQKLQELRSFHRHTNSSHGHSHNPLRRRDSSSSSSSDSDSQKKRSRKNTIDIDKDILEKQMMEMIAREEAEENEAKLSQEPDLKDTDFKEPKSLPSSSVRPDRLENSDSTGGSRQHSRRGSFSNAGGVEETDYAERPKITSSQRPSRESLEVPPFWGRPSLESESSPPNSPEARTSRRDNYFMPGIGTDLSPASSRGGSPSRNPFSKVKQMFRDRSRERASERQHDIQSSEKEDGVEIVAVSSERLSTTPELVDKRGRSRSRNGSVGPEPKIVSSRLTGDSQKSHRKTNSMRLGDPGAGLRSLFKGPRIDSVLKSGVSKVSELLWKKESEAEDSDSSTSSSDGTDVEERGRRKQGKSLSPTASIRGRPGHLKQESKHFLDVMPPFVSASDTGRHAPAGVSLSRPASRRSTRFELLKPPRIDISVADSSTDTQRDQAVDVSDSEPRMSNIHEEPLSGGRRPGSAWSAQSPKTRRFSAAFTRDSRHFSLSEQTSVPERALLTRREVARVRALILSSGVMAMNISRRAHQTQVLDVKTANESSDVVSALGNRVSWPEITQLAPEDQRQELLSKPISEADLFPVTARVLGTAIQTSRQRWESAAESFRHRTRSDINGQIEQLRTRLQLDLSAMTRAAAEEADEVSGDLVDGQRRKVKAVVDVIDKLSRRRRRRFRWARRAGWLALEWALVGFMWYVWLVVMIARVFLGVGKGFVRGVRWLLWL